MFEKTKQMKPPFDEKKELHFLRRKFGDIYSMSMHIFIISVWIIQQKITTKKNPQKNKSILLLHVFQTKKKTKLLSTVTAGYALFQWTINIYLQSSLIENHSYQCGHLDMNKKKAKSKIFKWNLVTSSSFTWYVWNEQTTFYRWPIHFEINF